MAVLGMRHSTDAPGRTQRCKGAMGKEFPRRKLLAHSPEELIWLIDNPLGAR